MPCLLLIVILAFPRLGLALLFLFTHYLDRAFNNTMLLLILGFLFLPYTTLFYALVYAPGRGVDAFGWFIVALGVVFDLSSHLFSSRARGRRARRSAEA